MGGALKVLVTAGSRWPEFNPVCVARAVEEGALAAVRREEGESGEKVFQTF
jgi:hypothetical protein